MKKMLLILLCLIFTQAVQADDFAKLRIKISGAMSDNRFFLCVGGVGCVSIKAGNEGKVFPLSPGNIDYIYTTSVTNLRLYTQDLPASCNSNIKSNQTVTVTGQIVKRQNQTVYIRNLNCTIV